MSEIRDERIKPYFIKLVNSSYEVHQEHFPKDPDKKPYTKFVCVKDSIRSALTHVAKIKLSTKRRTKKTVLLQEYLQELKVMQSVVEELLDDESYEKKIRNLERRITNIESRMKVNEVNTKIASGDFQINL